MAGVQVSPIWHVPDLHQANLYRKYRGGERGRREMVGGGEKEGRKMERTEGNGKQEEK